MTTHYNGSFSPHFSTQNQDMGHDTIGSSPIEIPSQYDRKFNPSVMETVVPYRLSIGSWSGVGASTTNVGIYWHEVGVKFGSCHILVTNIPR